MKNLEVRGEVRYPVEYLNHIILPTKLSIPTIQSPLVSRSRLLQYLNKGIEHKLVIVTAPAGFGKSTLIGGWANQSNMPVAWLALDSGDNDAVRFWTYFIHALQQVHPQIGRTSLELLQSTAPIPLEKVLTILINELHHIQQDFAIVVDDYHVLREQKIHDSLHFLLKHLPASLHMYISSRSVPSFPLATMRIKGELLEITIEELRFTLDEMTTFCNQVHGLYLTRKEIDALNIHMEGWIAGIHLAALAMRHSANKLDMINKYASSHRDIHDYLIEETLTHLPAEVKEFLLNTCILGRFNASLCAAITGVQKAQQIIEFLEQNNLFIISLDSERKWYRYHSIFMDSLRILAHKSYSETLPALHQKASVWYNEHGFVAEAVAHAIAATEFDAVAQMIEQHAPHMFKTGHLDTLVGWLSELPEQIIHSRPLIWLNHIWVMVLTGELEAAEKALHLLQEKMKSYEWKYPVEIVDQVNYDLISMDAYIAHLRGADDALDKFIKASTHFLDAGLVVHGFSFNIGYASLLQSEMGMRGSLKQMASFYKQTAPIMGKLEKQLPSFAIGYAMLSEIYYELGEVEEAIHYVDISFALGRKSADLGMLVPVSITAARIKMMQNNTIAALEIMNKIEKIARELESTRWLSIIRAQKVKIHVKEDTKAAQSWLNSCGLEVDDELSSLQEYEYITYARILLSLSQMESALYLLERLIPTVELEGGLGSLIEIYSLLALGFQKLGRLDQAYVHIEKALLLAMPEGYYRLFLDEGEPLAKLLFSYKTKKLWQTCQAEQAPLLHYVEQLLQGFAQDESLYGDKQSPSDFLKKSKEAQLIADLLTSREWEVLQQLAKGSSNKEIADHLFISVITVKVHLKNIYQKFGTKSRTQTLTRARELHLI